MRTRSGPMCEARTPLRLCDENMRCCAQFVRSHPKLCMSRVICPCVWLWSICRDASALPDNVLTCSSKAFAKADSPVIVPHHLIVD